MREKEKPESSPGYVRRLYMEVDSEGDRNFLRQDVARFALGRDLTEEELEALRVWRESRPELAVGEAPIPHLGFSFRAHFSNLSVTEFYSKEGKINEARADVSFGLYHNEAYVTKWLG